jgi:phospholipid-binding lipoprotein MlaA
MSVLRPIVIVWCAALIVIGSPGARARAQSESDSPTVGIPPSSDTSAATPTLDAPPSPAPASETGGATPPDSAAAVTPGGTPEGTTERTSLQELEQAEAELAEYDPWLPFNEKTFAFNHGLDRHVIKPVAEVYDRVVPNLVQRAVRNFFDNVASFRRIINTALQGRFDATGQELGRFVINTTFGVGGLIDAAPSFGVAPMADADTGQTFGAWGAGPGPYLVVPLLPPLTVRDAFGFAFDAVMDPLAWVAPFEVLLGITTEKAINDRSLNLELYENVEETVFDLYSAVRNAYLQRRQKAVNEAISTASFGRRERLILTGPR